jgi:outer membrane protein TolC
MHYSILGSGFSKIANKSVKDNHISKTGRALLSAFVLIISTRSAALSANQPATPSVPQPPGVNQQQLGKQIRIKTEDLTAQQNLLDVVDEATKTSGAIFEDPQKVFVKPPVLSALISIDRRLSPLQLDADRQSEINLHDVLLVAMNENLPIKISQAETGIARWNYYGALANFLPSLTNDLAFQYLNGAYVSPAGLAIPIKNPYYTSSNSFSQYLYKGGSILHTAKENKDLYRASKFALSTTINDALTDVAKLYYQLVLNDVLLQIRIKAVEVSKGLVLVNEDQFANGANTKLDVLQAKYQLSDDRQKLIAQQIARRQAAVNLAAALNADTGVDLILKNRTIGKVRLIDDKLMPADLLKIAVDQRPELKKYEQLRLAAKEAIKVAKAALLPAVAATGSIIGSGSRVFPSNSLSQSSTPVVTSASPIGAISQASGLPLSGTSSGGKRWSARSLFEIGVDLSWNLPGLGFTPYSGVQSARYNARKVQLQGQQELEKVYQQVRDAFLSSLSAENLINETTDAVNYAEEALRLAEIRLKEGVGTYVEVIIAQRNYTASLIDKANAIIKFDMAQVDLLRAIGRTSVATASGGAQIHD